MNGARLLEYVAQAPRLILDAGCGPQGSYWWPAVPATTQVVAVDLYHRPPTFPPNVEFIAMDLMTAGERPEWAGRFDLIVADHLLEHLPDPRAAAGVLAWLLAPDGALHVGFPDATFFTDRFYRLIHPTGGGHIARLTRASALDAMAEVGLEAVLIEPWEDDWTWLTDAYSLDQHGIRLLAQEELVGLAEVLRRELTAEKGYLYGWEMVFRHVAGHTPPPGAAVRRSEAPRAETPADGPWRRRWRRFRREYLEGTPGQRALVRRDLARLVGRVLRGR